MSHLVVLACVHRTYFAELVSAQWHKPIMAHDYELLPVMDSTFSFEGSRVEHLFFGVLSCLQMCSGTESWPMFCGRTMTRIAAVEEG